MIVVIAGTGRCGTHTVQELFADAENTVALHEGHGVVEGKPVRLGDMKAINIYEGRLGRIRNIDLRKVRKEVFRSRKEIISENPSKEIVLTNRMNYRMIKHIYDKYEDVKVIHLVRNGYDCVRSWHSRPGLYRGLDKIFIERLIKNTKNILKSVRSFYSLSYSPNNINQLNRDNHFNYLLEKPIPMGIERLNWPIMDRIEKTCWYWKFVNSYIEDTLKVIPEEDKRRLKIEELDREEAKKLSHFTKIDLMNGFEFGRKRDKSKSENIWNEKNIRKFNNMCGEYMKKLDYDTK